MSRFLVHRFVRRFVSAAAAVAGLASVLIVSQATQAQTQYQLPNTQTTFSVGKTPLGVASADFAQNGFQGMVVTNSQSNQMTVFVGSGPAVFANTNTYPTCAGPASVLATDLNGDGYPDIAVACPTANSVDVFLNNGTGNFPSSPSQSVPVTDPVAMVAGEFAGAGQVGIAVAGGGGNITVLRNIGNGTASTTVSLSGGFSGIATADFNNDGFLDLAVSDSPGNKVDVLFGDGAGNFKPSGSYAVGTHPSGIATADFNHDDHPDLAVTNAGSNNVSLLFGSAAGTFTPQNFAPGAGTDPIGIAVTDANGDGNSDIIAFDAAIGTNTSQGSVAVLLGNSGGTFQPALIEPLSVIPGPQAAVADFNRDGKPDLAIAEQTSGSVALMLDNLLPTPAQGGRSFAAANTLTEGYGNMADGVAVADFNHDGLLDVAVSYLEDNSVRVLLNNGGGPSNFNPATAYGVGKQPYSVVAGDLNGDGYADLVTVNTTDGTISVLLNNGSKGNGTFGAAATYTVGRLPFNVAIGDLNGDGFPDLAVTNMGANSVSVLFGKGDGTFTPGPTLTTGVNPFGVAIGDFAHNGHSSIAVTCYHTSQLYVFPNDGTGTFGTPFITSTGPSPTSVVVGDFNRDGNLDIVTGNSTGNNVSFFAGDGKGNFAADAISPALNFPVTIAAGDINGDGILDLVSVAPNFNQVMVALGKGDGTFGTFQQRAAGEFPAGTQPWAVALGDFNNDGKLDIVTANTFNRVNIASPAYQQMYMKQFPPTQNGNASIDVLTNYSGTMLSLSTSPSQFPVSSTTPITLTGKVGAAIGGATPTGSIMFEDTTGTPLGTAIATLNHGAASLTLQNMGSGQHVITTLYSGDGNYQPNASVDGSLVIGVNGTPVTLSLTPSSVDYGNYINVTITVTGSGSAAPTGNVILYAYNEAGVQGRTNTTLNFTSTNGNVSTFQGQIGVDLPLGNYELYAVYNPGNYPSGSSPNEPLTVSGEAMTVSLNCSPQNTDFGFFPPNQQTCYSQVTDASGNIVQQGNVVFSITNGASQTVPIEYNFDINPTFFEYNAEYMFPNPSSSYYTMTATFPASGNYGTGTNTASFCTNGPGTCTLPAAARSGGVRALDGRSGPTSVNGLQGLQNNVGHFGFQRNGFGNRPGAFGPNSIPRLRVIHRGAPVIDPQPPVIAPPPTVPGPPVRMQPRQNPPSTTVRPGNSQQPGAAAATTPGSTVTNGALPNRLNLPALDTSQDPRFRP
ncbi:MAG: FG-GAP-like repeat-containing protein [Acidobacteriaceae bacterium]